MRMIEIKAVTGSGTKPGKDSVTIPRSQHEKVSLSPSQPIHFLQCLLKRAGLTPEFNIVNSLPQVLRHAYRGKTLLAYGRNFARMPFLPPPMTHMGNSGS